MGAKLRAFVAVEINEEIRKGLSDLTTRLMSTKADVKWVVPENIHITLKFLGYMGDEQVASASEIIRNAITAIDPFPIAIEHIGAFPNLKRPRIVFAAVHEESNNLATIYTRLDNDLAELGIERDGRQYKPHLTVGRVKSLKNVTALITAMDTLKDASFGHQTVEGIALMQSDLRPTGPVYSRLEEFKFRT